MKELTEEIKLTINLMQGDIDDGAHSELQSHLYSLLEMKRSVLQQQLVEPTKPLTIEELMAGGWWCADVSKDCANAFKSKNFRVFNSFDWRPDGAWSGCTLDDDGDVVREFFGFTGNKQIHRVGNEFYWGDDL